jgi:two-component system NarL family sensor kinase
LKPALYRTFTICVAICCLYTRAMGIIVQVNTDSLQKVITANKHYPAVIGAYKQLTYQQSLQQFSKAKITADKGIALAGKKKDSVSVGTLIDYKGKATYFMGAYDSAATYYLQAIKILERTNALKETGEVYNDLARLYRKTKQYPRALRYYDNAMKTFRMGKDSSGVAAIYNESGVVFEEQGNYPEAIKRYNASLKIQQAAKFDLGIGYSYSFLGEVYGMMHQYDKAESYMQAALNIRLKLKDTMAIASSYQDIATIYSFKGDYVKCRQNMLLSNELAKKMGYVELQAGNYQLLAENENNAGNYKQAYAYQQQYNTLKDSVFKTASIKHVNELAAQYETEKKEQQIKLLNGQNTIQKLIIDKRNITITVTIVLLVGALGFGFLFYNRYRLKQEARLQAEVINQQNLASKRIIEAEERERKRIAGDLHDGVGQLFSAVKLNMGTLLDRIDLPPGDDQALAEKTMAMVDESCREVRSIAHQMMPNILLKIGLASAVKDFVGKIESNRLKITVETAGLNQRLDQNTEIVLYRVIQESVNNVIKHAAASRLDIQLVRESTGVTATIEDNGKGFNTNNQDKFEGIGLKNIITRVEYLKGTVDISSSPKKGTLVAIYIPLT